MWQKRTVLVRRLRLKPHLKPLPKINIAVWSPHSESDLDDDSVGWQVDSPGQGGGAHQHLEVASGEHALHQAAVGTQHTGVVDPKTIWEHLPHLLVSGALDLVEGRRLGRREGYKRGVGGVEGGLGGMDGGSERGREGWLGGWRVRGRDEEREMD